MPIQPLTKPLPGEHALDRRARRNAIKAHERKEMQAALMRDGKKCRLPRCEFPTLRVDPAHRVHRGMGGNPLGDRTERKTVIALCVRHHRDYDWGDLEIEPLTSDVFDGPCAFYRRDAHGQMAHWASERVIGVSVERSAR